MAEIMAVFLLLPSPCRSVSDRKPSPAFPTPPGPSTSPLRMWRRCQAHCLPRHVEAVRDAVQHVARQEVAVDVNELRVLADGAGAGHETADV
jgi:hypothetical protein